MHLLVLLKRQYSRCNDKDTNEDSLSELKINPLNA